MMVHDGVYITVRNSRAFVARYVATNDGSISWECAVNAMLLERAALEEVVAQGGYITRNGNYSCPPELAARASWQRPVEIINFNS